MTKIDLERFIGDVIFNRLSYEWDISSLFEMALRNQGLKFKSDLDGWKIVPIEPLPEDSVRKQVAEFKESLLNDKSEELSQPEVTKISEQVWSEDDEEKFAKVYYATLNFYGGDISLAWLKSLKKRLGGL